MNGKITSLIGMAVGIISFIFGLWFLYQYLFKSQMTSKDIGFILTIFGTIIFYSSINIIKFVLELEYNTEIKVVNIVAILLVIGFFIINFIQGFNLETYFLYSVIYLEMITLIIWLFIWRYATLNKEKIRRSGKKWFEFSFIFFLFLSTVFITLGVGKMTVLNWKLFDFEVITYLYLLGFCYVSAFISGWIHYHV